MKDNFEKDKNDSIKKLGDQKKIKSDSVKWIEDVLYRSTSQ